MTPAPVPMSRRSLFLPHLGHFLRGEEVMDWNWSKWWPQASHLYS